MSYWLESFNNSIIFTENSSGAFCKLVFNNQFSFQFIISLSVSFIFGIRCTKFLSSMRSVMSSAYDNMCVCSLSGCGMSLMKCIKSVGDCDIFVSQIYEDKINVTNR